MEIGRQIKKYRLESKLSQEALAEKIFVTRQTISNWENGKNYPDLNSVVLLSNLFDVSLDILIKGDVEEMKEQINSADIRKFNQDGAVYTVLFIATIVTVVPLFLWSWIGIGIWAVLAGTMMYYANRVEKQKKAHNIQTYKEIIAFTEGKSLDEIEKERENAKRPYQSVLLVIGTVVLTLLVSAVMFFIFR